jgi:hypothetical protein
MRAKLRFIFVAVCLGVGFLVTGAAHAGWVASGDLIKVLDTAGPRFDGGGPFTIDNVTNPLAQDFVSFCLERNEYLNFNTEYRAELSPIAFNGGVGGRIDINLGDRVVPGDPLDTKTAFLYSNFFHGTLNNLLSGWTTVDLQKVFWHIEQELPCDFNLFKNAKAKELYNLANTKSNGSLYDACVMNLYHPTTGVYQQSLLTTVPEPATIVIWGVFGACGLLYARRRRKAAR